MGIFTKPPVYSKKSLVGSWWKNRTMKKIMADPAMQKTLNEKREQKEFFNVLKSKAQGGVTKKELKEVVTFFRKGKGKTINSREGLKIAQKFFKSASNRYVSSSELDSTLSAKSESLAPKSKISVASQSRSNKMVKASVSSPVQSINKKFNTKVIPLKNTNSALASVQSEDTNKEEDREGNIPKNQFVKRQGPRTISTPDFKWLDKYRKAA